MHWTEYLWLAIGFTAQISFGARFVVQWVLSERARRSLMPIHFWYFSVLGAVLLLAYAVHRRDPVIAAGQLLGLAIYFRNLEFIRRDAGRAGVASWFPPWLGLSLLAVVVGYGLGPDSASRPLQVDSFWTTFGFIGQFLFTSRFVVQWLVSERARRSVTPIHFWYLSITGSLMLLIYAVSILDPVIILGQSLGFVVYLRNLVLLRRAAGRLGSESATP
jgi:lipid-A-disaccharide synthase-like uncharacterized protein